VPGAGRPISCGSSWDTTKLVAVGVIADLAAALG
jgi:hypothetical protein